MYSSEKKRSTKNKTSTTNAAATQTTMTITTTTTSTKTTTPALEVPEILARVGYFLPKFSVKAVKTSWSGEEYQHRFRPNVFHNCFLVCRFWYSTLLPVLWRDYVYKEMQHLPPRVLGRYSLLFRRFDSYGGCQGPFNCTLLETLSLHRDHDQSKGSAVVHNMSMQTQRKLVRMNPGLDYLGWEGSESKRTRARLEVQDFELLDNLQQLRLERWNSHQGSLVNVLRTVSRTLERLYIQDIYDFKESDIRTAPRTQGSGGGGRGQGEESSLVMPRIVLLHLPVIANNTELVYLVGCCPSLLRLDLDILDTHLDADRLAKTLKARCPNLRTLAIHDTREVLEGGLQISPLIRTCSKNGLIKIEFIALTINTDVDIIPSMLTHFATLEHVYIDYFCQTQGGLDPRNILRLLVECRKLKSCFVTGGTGMSTLSSLKILKSKPWMCRDLEGLDLNLDGDTLTSERAYVSDMVAPAKISSKTSFMGWYRHDQEYTCTDEEALTVPKFWLKELFGMVKGLNRLQFVTLNLVTYSRSSDPTLTLSYEKYSKII